MPHPALRDALLLGANVGRVRVSLSYGFNLGTADNGNVLQIQNNMDASRSQTFTYDELNRIKTAEVPTAWGLSFGYDIWANLLSQTVTKGSAPMLSVSANTKNQISGCYDSAGNLLGEINCSAYAYDAENRMSASAAGGLYFYDGDGKRVKKSSGTLYWTGIGSDALAESDLAANFTDEYVFFAGKRIARRKSTGEVHYYFADHLGTSRIVTSATGTVLDDADFYPFGRERPILSSSGNSYKFTGKERDPETGLDYFGARYYDSHTGRFMTPDEFSGGPVDAFSSNDPIPDSPLPYADITNPQSLNKYAYTYNNPLRYTDPNGHDLKDFLLGFANAVGSNNLAGYGRQEAHNRDNAIGQAVGDFASVLQGLAEAEIGGAAAGGGLVVSASGAGAVVGAPAAVAGAALATHGAVTAGSGIVHLAKAANPDKPGEVYVTEPQPRTDKPYVGRTTQGVDNRMQKRIDGRTGEAKTVAKYKTTPEGRLKEQREMNKRGGIKNLDNKRNEVDPKKMPELKKKVEGK